MIGAQGLGHAMRVVLAVALAAAVVCVPAAFADEAADGSNAVDTQQLPDSSFIYDTSIVDLGAADSYYDNQTVQVTGEVVGDKITANASEGYCWITLAASDGLSTIAIHLTEESAAKIDTFGAYGTTGTTLQVQGTYNLACGEHDGASDVHAQIVTVVKTGSAHADSLELEEFFPGLALVAVGLVMIGLLHWLRERQR